jgi:methylthioribulose-1-phosphate dehydratase
MKPTTNSDLSPTPAVLSGWEQPIDALRACGAYFHSRGWSVGTSSNYSVVLGRDPLELCVTASGMDKGRLERCDFVRVGADGQPTSLGQPKSSAETLLHVAVAQRLTDVGCILHTHSIWGTLLSDYYAADGGITIEGYEMLKGFSGVSTHEYRAWIEIFENTQDIPSLAEKVSARLCDSDRPLRHGYLIKKHGLYTWGRDVAEARRHVEIFEFLLECEARRLTLPDQ